MEQQVTIMTTADTYLSLGALILLMAVATLLLTQRSLPPRLKFTGPLD